MNEAKNNGPDQIPNHKTTLLLGATGRTGSQVLEKLIQEGHIVHVVVRDRTSVLSSSDKVIVFEGDVTNADTIGAALVDCETIISALNVSRTSDFPWSKLRTPKTFLSDTMSTILKVADPTVIKKIVVCSAWGANESKKEIPSWFRWLINNSNIGPAYKDHERQEELLRTSKFNYTIVRPVGLTNSKGFQTILTINSIPKPKLTISRKNTARFLVEQLSDNRYQKQAVTISGK